MVQIPGHPHFAGFVMCVFREFESLLISVKLNKYEKAIMYYSYCLSSDLL